MSNIGSGVSLNETPSTMTPVGGSSSTTANPVTTTPNETISTNNSAPTGALTFAQVENIWIQAGGNPQAAAMAAAIADASSGLNTAATYTNPDGTQTVGLWLIPTNGIPPGTTDPLANARAAIQISQNGTNWQEWCSAWSDNDCGCQGGSYLGDGSNALASLAGQLGTAAYNVIGSQPSSTGVGAGTATSTATSSTTGTSSTGKYLTIALLIILVVIVFVMVRHKTKGQSGGSESEGRSQEDWTPSEETRLNESGQSDKELSAELGRSVRSIRVRRNQMKSR
jgi:Lysozyme like domain